MTAAALLCWCWENLKMVATSYVLLLATPPCQSNPQLRGDLAPGVSGSVIPGEMTLYLPFVFWCNLQKFSFEGCNLISMSPSLRIEDKTQTAKLSVYLGELRLAGGTLSSLREPQVWFIIWSVVILTVKIWLLRSAFSSISIKKIGRRCSVMKVAF